MVIGNMFFQAREIKGLTLKDVMDATKIRRKFLEALESEQFHILPERTYARCFLSTYSRFLGLNTSELLKEFDQIYPSETEYETQKEPMKLQKPNHKVASHQHKTTTRSRLAADRDVKIVLQIRKKLSAKKRLTWWKQFLRRFYKMA